MEWIWLVVIIYVGVCLGSFVNALVWRLHKQIETEKKSIKPKGHKVGGRQVDLSVSRGRSVCTHCGHKLAVRDLVPVLSWLWLRGKCRYCQEPISWQYPVVELATATLFAVSYIFWPDQLSSASDQLSFVIWLTALVGFMALIVYDIRWMLLPNRIIYPLITLAAAGVLLQAATGSGLSIIGTAAVAVAISGGLFFLLFQISDGKWIGGGDIKLGFLAGLLLADPYLAFLMLFMASILGTVVVLPPLLMKRLKVSSRIPFGPFLIVATIVTKLFGSIIVDWYKRGVGL